MSIFMKFHAKLLPFYWGYVRIDVVDGEHKCWFHNHWFHNQDYNEGGKLEI